MSYHTLDMDYWERAERNFPVKAGDTFWTEPGARAALQFGAGVVRLESQTEVEVKQLDDRLAEVEVMRCAINFRLRWLDRDETYRIAIPAGALELTRPGRYHIEAFDDGRPARFDVIEGEAELIVADGPRLMLRDGEAVWAAAGQRELTVLRALVSDFDQWADEEEAQVTRVARTPSYVARDLPGIDDLSVHGAWDRTPDYGVVWYPTVAYDWAPYRYGHWAYVAPWGWTWIDEAPWGFAPFHYGRWVMIRGRWAWIPGTVVRRPVYAPALVVFIGPGIFIGIGYNVAWIPLGPREVYVPPYRTSIAYVRNINVTHVTNVTNITVNNITVNRNVTNYVNATQVTAVPSAAMSSSRHVAEARVEVDQRSLGRVETQRDASVKPTLATRGATRAVVAAVGGEEMTAPPEEKTAPGPKPRVKTPPEALLRPLAPAEPRPERGGADREPQLDQPRGVAPQLRREPETQRPAAPNGVTPQIRREQETPRPAAPVEAAPPPARGRQPEQAPQVRREPAKPAPTTPAIEPTPAPARGRQPEPAPQVRREPAPPTPLAPAIEAAPAPARGRQPELAPQIRREPAAAAPAVPVVEGAPAPARGRAAETPPPGRATPQRTAPNRGQPEGCRPGDAALPGAPPCPDPQPDAPPAAPPAAPRGR